MASTVFRIHVLNTSHDRKAFDCGQPDLNAYLQKTASQHNKKQVSRTWVIVDSEQPESILGYATTTLTEIEGTFLNPVDAKKLPARGLPAVRLSRLAVHQECQSKQIGQRLLLDVMRRTTQLLDNFAVVALLVDAKDERAAEYYQKFGFISWYENPLKLYLPVATLLSLMTEPTTQEN